MRVLLTADLQVGAGQDLGIGQYGPGSRFHDQQEMLSQIATLAFEENVEIVCVLGDVFDRARPEPHEILLFQRFVRGLTALNIQVFVLLGNHDSRGATLPSILEVFGEAGCVVALQPSAYPLGDIVIAALPWTPPGAVISANPGMSRDEVNDRVSQSLVNAAHLLAERCRNEYPDAKSLLLGHWAVSGAALPTGLDTAQLREPVIPLDGLTSSGFDLAMFGHIHLAGMLASGPTPVGFTGSPWVDHWGETEGDHGVWIYDTAGALKFHPVTDPRRFVTIDVEFVDVRTMGAGPQYAMTMKTQAPPLKDALVRVRYSASEDVARHIDQDALRQQILMQGAAKVFIKPTVERAVRARSEEAGAEDLGAEAALELWLTSQDIDPDLAERLRAAHATYLEAVRQ